MHSPEERKIEEFRKHQEDILPFTKKYLGKTNLDIGCGNGITSVIHQEELGIEPTLCDVKDIRHEVAKDFPFFLTEKTKLPFEDSQFDSSYLQYVLHHILSADDVLDLLREAFRVSNKVIIVEEVRGRNTEVEKALHFDKDVNSKIYPGEDMPVYKYYTPEEIKDIFEEIGHKVIYHKVVSLGNEENGFLETHIFVGE